MVIEGVGTRLKTARIFAKMKQRDLASKLGVSEPKVSRWETDRDNMTIPEIVDAARVLGVDPAELAPGKFAKSI